MQVGFKYRTGQKVKTIFGDIGYIEIASINVDGSIQYWVQRSSDSQWLRENQISDLED